ncbi:MAG TPA: hypothetical protein VMV69_28955 [Pirellulales bacterium]|nr:hypothetical protein [Pirellulales bacterium]
MPRSWMLKRLALAALLAAAAIGLGGPSAHAADLFYNYYVPGVNGGPPAQLFLCPRPTPPLVGHTYITYQPFYPNEMLYPHNRTYTRCDGIHCVAANRTTVRWSGSRFPGRRWGNWEIPHHQQIRNLQHP